MSTSDIERPLIQKNWAEHFGGDIARESGGFACDVLRNINLKNLDAVIFEDERKRQIAGSIIEVRKDLLSNQPDYFQAGFKEIQDFANDLKLMIMTLPDTTPYSIMIANTPFNSREFLSSLKTNPMGISVMRFVGNYLVKSSLMLPGIETDLKNGG